LKPILHIVKNCDDTQAIRIIEHQARDNAYGVTAVFVRDAASLPPLIPNARVCVVREAISGRDDPPGAASGPVEFIDFSDLLNLIFSVESVAVW
jgi:hypothetical protein